MVPFKEVVKLQAIALVGGPTQAPARMVPMVGGGGGSRTVIGALGLVFFFFENNLFNSYLGLSGNC